MEAINLIVPGIGGAILLYIIFSARKYTRNKVWSNKKDVK